MESEQNFLNRVLDLLIENYDNATIESLVGLHQDGDLSDEDVVRLRKIFDSLETESFELGEDALDEIDVL